MGVKEGRNKGSSTWLWGKYIEWKIKITVN